VYIIFSIASVSKILHFEKYLASYTKMCIEMHTDLDVKHHLLLSDFNQNISTDFNETSQYQVS
jgi:hypothetical protein